MIELITPQHAVMWDGHSVQVIGAADGSIRALHVAHIQDVKLARGLVGSGYNVSVIGSAGHNLLIPIEAAQLNDAETFVAEITGAITRRKAGKA